MPSMLGISLLLPAPHLSPPLSSVVLGHSGTWHSPALDVVYTFVGLLSLGQGALLNQKKSVVSYGRLRVVRESARDKAPLNMQNKTPQCRRIVTTVI